MPSTVQNHSSNLNPNRDWDLPITGSRVCKSGRARDCYGTHRPSHWQWCGQDRSETKKTGLGLGLAGLVLCCETRSCYAHRHNDLEGHSKFSSTIYSFSILYLEHHYCGDQQWSSLTYKLNPPTAFVYFRWSWSWFWSCYFGLGLGLKDLVLFTSLPTGHTEIESFTTWASAEL